jgi:hypothetical protein
MCLQWTWQVALQVCRLLLILQFQVQFVRIQARFVFLSIARELLCEYKTTWGIGPNGRTHVSLDSCRNQKRLSRRMFLHRQLRRVHLQRLVRQSCRGLLLPP